jgi:hypothetical protein
MTALELDEGRALVRAWCEYACDGDRGRGVDDPVYRWIVEGRDPGPRYSSCPDLAYWWLELIGVRESWINRESVLGQRPNGNVHVGRLCCPPVGSNPIATAPRPGEVFACGDVLVCWSKPDTTDAHVFTCATHDAERGILRSWDAGQGPMSARAWSTRRDHVEVRRVEREVFERAGRWTFAAGRSIRSVLRLSDVLALPGLVDPERPTGEALDARGLPAWEGP